ncbi:hypothetical protein BZZ01_05020 [Nostocales cyanobacterium HT-58-2]|nr:hypothetical protein BZZ01_05020 [Nostocales cyanobacterium HT-58-2]
MLTIDFTGQSKNNIYNAYLSRIILNQNTHAPLIKVGYGEVQKIVVETPTNIVVLPQGWTEVKAVVINGRSLTPAQNPESPQENEYVYNPYTNTVQVSGEARSVQIYGTVEDVGFIPPLLPPPYPSLFTQLPLQGTIQLNRQFEQQPSASFEMELTLDKSTLQQIFAPGAELDLYGLPLRINNISITELSRAIYPDARCKLSVSLGSRWENYLEKPIFLREDGKNNAAVDEPFQDSECISSATGVLAGAVSTTVQKLLERAGIKYIGPELPLVPVPRDTPRDAIANPAQLLQERLRVANSFLRWSNPAGVEAVPIDSVGVWTYQESDILGEVETGYEAIGKESKKPIVISDLNPVAPDLVNFPSSITLPPVPNLKKETMTALGFEYPNVEMSGRFSEIANNAAERTQGSSVPRYERKEPQREERVDGDVYAHVPLEGMSLIQTMSLCFDIGGQTKTRSFTTLEDGAEISVINEVWGFAFTAIQIYEAASGTLRGGVGECWKLLKQTRTDYTYDPTTGYLLYVTESGVNTVRFKQENAESPETLQLGASDPEYALYNFIKIPVVSRTSYKLQLMPEYSTGGFEVIKVCNRDGTSSLIPLINPDYAPPYYVAHERTESVAFTSKANPANEGLSASRGDKLEPPLIVGEESCFEAITQITPAVYEEKYIGSRNGLPIYQRGREISPQKWVKYVKKFKAQGQAIASALEETSIEQGTGNPPTAQKRPPKYEREEPQSTVPKQQYRYYLQSAGYTMDDPIGGTESFPLARTLEEALTAARCKYAIENWRSGLQERLQIPGNLGIKEGDRFNYWCNGEYRERVVLGASTTLNILGIVDGQPRVTAVTSLTLGRWGLAGQGFPDISYKKVSVPKQVNSAISVLGFQVVSAQLGQVLDWSNIRSRRNP